MQIKKDKRVEEYLNSVCRLIKNRRVHKNIKDELISHIEEIVEDYTSIDYTEEQAIEKALEQLGSYEAVGNELNKVHKAVPDWTLLAMTSAFILIGMFLLGYIDRNFAGELIPYGFLSKSIIYSLIGIGIAFIIIRVDYRNISKYSKAIYGGSLILMFGSLFFSNHINGIKGYIVLGPVAFNAFNVAAFLLVIALAGVFNKYNWHSKKNILIGFAVIFVPSILFVVGTSIPSLSIYLIGAFTIALISGLRPKYFLGATASILALGSVYVFAQPYRAARITAFITHYSDATGSGWIYNTLAQLRNQGGLFGSEKAFSPEMLPDFYTDFMLTFIMYSFGWIVALVIIALVLAFIIRIGFIGARTRESYGKLLVSGLCGYFAAQFGFNILMNFTLTPIVSIGMPFISYGGSSFIINILTIGIITSVYKWRNTPFITKKALN